MSDSSIRPPTSSPPAWYAVGPASRVGRRNVVPFEVDGLEGVLFRASDGTPAALDRRCPHFGADLAAGYVDDGAVVCPLHHWRWRGDGKRCSDRADSDAESPCAVTWPVLERFGLLWVVSRPIFEDPRPTLPTPPTLLSHADERLTWSRPFSTEIACDWQCAVANGFDLEHLSTVHHRRMVAEPRFGPLEGDRFRLEYTTQSVGGGLRDRVMRWLSKGRIEASMTCFGGPTVVIESRTARSAAAAVIGLCPAGEGRCRATATFGIAARGPLAPTQAAIARWLFLGFLRRDLSVLVGMRHAKSYPLVREPCLAAFLEFLDGRAGDAE